MACLTPAIVALAVAMSVMGSIMVSP